MAMKKSSASSHKNIKAILEEAKFTFDDVVKSTVLLKDIKNFGKTTLKEVKSKLAQLSLTVGMQVPDKLLEK